MSFFFFLFSIRYGAATAYQGMHEFTQAKELMKEALRLHPRHPVLLGTMAEILFSLKAYDSAYMYIEESLATRNNISMEELKNKIKQKLDTQHEDGDDDDDVVAVGGLSL
jgi:predicted Zn-dependent protease